MRFISAIVKRGEETIQANYSSVLEVHIGYCKAGEGEQYMPIIVVFKRFISVIIKLGEGTLQFNQSSVHIRYYKAGGTILTIEPTIILEMTFCKFQM